MIVDREGREAERLCGLRVVQETLKGPRPPIEGYKRKVRSVIHEVPPVSRRCAYVASIDSKCPGRKGMAGATKIEST